MKVGSLKEVFWGAVFAAVLAIAPMAVVSSVHADEVQERQGKQAPQRIPYSELTSGEREILRNGPIDTGPYVAGGVVGTFFGLGIGHAVQGRYGEIGWVFTVGELASAALLVSGMVDCVGESLDYAFSGTGDNCDSLNTAGTIGLIGLFGFRIWEIVDLWASPPKHNRRYEWLRDRTEGAPRRDRFSLMVVPVAKNEVGLSAGIQYRF